MANFFDQFDSTPEQAAPQERPRAQSPYSGAIKSIESGGNYRALGPVTRDGDRAYGFAQVMGKNVGPWTKEIVGREMTPQEFLNDDNAQDAVFNAKFGEYAKKYGPEGAAKAWFAGEKGMNNPNARDILGTSVTGYAEKFNKALGPQTMGFAPQEQAAPAQAGNFFDQFDNTQQPAPQQPAQPTFDQRFQQPEPPSNPDGLRFGLERAARDLTRGPEASVVQRLSTDTQNQQIAASQRTTPNINAQMRNLVSDNVFENDAGMVMFRDPATGQMIEAEDNKHVVLRDPNDSRLKVFERTENTDEGLISSSGRMLMSGMATGAPNARATVAAAPVLTPSQQVGAAAQRIGVDLPRAVSTDSTAAQRIAAAVRNVPIAGDPLVNATGRAVSSLGTAADDAAKGFGGGTVAGSGDAAKTAINQYVTGTTKARSAKLYDAVDDLVDNSVLAPLTKTQQTVQNILSRRGEAALPPGGAVDQLNEALARPGMTYQGLKTLRSNVGEDVSRSILPQGMSQGDLKQIYSSLSDDLKGAVGLAGGPKASSAFERANRYYKLVSDRREALAKIVGTVGDAPVERVFDRLVAMASGSSRADISGLMQARKSIGADDWNEFVSGVVSQMGRSPAAKGAPETLQGVEFSPERFLTAYNKLSDAGHSVLFKSGGKGELASSLRDIATVSSRFRELQKFSNPSGTAQNTIGGATGASLITPLFLGDVMTPLAVVGSVVGGRMMASVLAKPATAASIADWSRKYEAAARVPTAPRVALLSVASRNLANTLKDSGVTVSASDFLKAIQGPMKSAADDENPEPVRGVNQ